MLEISQKNRCKTSAKPMYIAVKFNQESNDLLNAAIAKMGLTKDFTDDFHCTISYSKKPVVFNPSTQTGLNIKARIKGFGHFDTNDGKNLHVILDCPFCEIEFQRAMKAGASYDYDKYTAHISLVYNCKDFTYSNQADEFIGKELIINQEYSDTLNESWLEDNKEDDMKVQINKAQIIQEAFLDRVNDIYQRHIQGKTPYHGYTKDNHGNYVYHKELDQSNKEYMHGPTHVNDGDGNIHKVDNTIHEGSKYPFVDTYNAVKKDVNKTVEHSKQIADEQKELEAKGIPGINSHPMEHINYQMQQMKGH